MTFNPLNLIAVIATALILGACAAPMTMREKSEAKWDPHHEYYSALSVEELEKEADTGSRDALLEIGIRLINGDNIPRDESRAVQIFSNLSAQNDWRATYLLGSAYIQGAGVEKDEIKGVELLRESAEAGYPMSEFWYGFMLSRGRGVDAVDWNEAIVWFLKAAKNGHPGAQFSMGEALSSCHGGIEPNFEEAAKWYRKAIKQKEMFARYNLERLIGLGLVEWKEGDPGSPPTDSSETEYRHCGYDLKEQS